MVNIVLRVERSQRQPLEARREMLGAHALPQQSAPSYMIVAVEIATTDALRRELNFSDNKADGYSAYQKIDHAREAFGHPEGIRFCTRFYRLCPAFCLRTQRRLANVLHKFFTIILSGTLRLS